MLTIKRIFLCLILIACQLTLVRSAYAQVVIDSKASPRCLKVGGKPMLMLGGELSNSAATCKADIDSVLPRMAALGLNTVLVPAQWDLMEPKEGQFDFSLIDETIDVARQNGLKIVFLWFGAWKNSMSCYAPLWFKRDTKRFPRATTEAGKPLEIASAFSENVFEADKRAFVSLLNHIAARDSKEHTVVMIQVENEIGMLESARDHSSLAEKAYHSGQWRKFLHVINIDKRDSRFVDEVFQAYYNARYVERLAIEGKKVLDVPFYVNAALNSRGRKPGEYPSAGPLAHLFPIWKSVAPHISLCAPDIYDTGFKGWVAQYATSNNILFVPESRCCVNSGVRALYTFGEHQAVGFSPFAIDQSPETDTWHVRKAYGLMRQLSDLFYKGACAGRLMTWGLLLSQGDKERIIFDGDKVLTCRHYFTLPWDPRATNGEPWQEGGAVVVRLADDEYLIAGSGVVVSFQTVEEKQQEESVSIGEDGFAVSDAGSKEKSVISRTFSGHRVGIGYVDEVSIDASGVMKYVRRENGDQNHQGRHARIPVGEYKLLHVKLYKY